ncbi:MAG: LemA family protein [Gammaproteobacteria bacterium]|nr:LemA family protein [Gammaproteobacteria bacterium]MCW5582913.1 LemA family protein [Gammaproteobacteria bacterium]
MDASTCIALDNILSSFRSKLIMFLILLLVLLVVIGYIILTYNRLIAQIEAVRNNQKQIDVQLDRRFKVFESLINVVKKYMDYEKTTLKEVVALRNQAQQAHAAGDEKTRIAAENKISSIATHLNVVFEQYPDLKANQNVLQLQEEIVSTENKLAYAKQSFNDSIEIYNASKKSFPNSVVVSAFRSKLDFDFPYWQLSEQKIAEHEAYTVKL